MRFLTATIMILWMVGLSGCSQTIGHEQIAAVEIRQLTKEELEENAWDKTPAEVRANLGSPTAIRHREDGEWWFYNHIQLRYDDGQMRCPQIHFKDGEWVSIGYTAPDEVDSFMNGDQWSSGD